MVAALAGALPPATRRFGISQIFRKISMRPVPRRSSRATVRCAAEASASSVGSSLRQGYVSAEGSNGPISLAPPQVQQQRTLRNQQADGQLDGATWSASRSSASALRNPGSSRAWSRA